MEEMVSNQELKKESTEQQKLKAIMDGKNLKGFPYSSFPDLDANVPRETDRPQGQSLYLERLRPIPFEKPMGPNKNNVNVVTEAKQWRRTEDLEKLEKACKNSKYFAYTYSF